MPRHKEDDQVVYIDGDSAPRILFSGEDLLLEDLPIGTRVIYPKPPIEGLANPGAAIRYALNHPLEAEPLYAQLAPGMRVTIAVDDISLPLPPMRTPDIRQTIIEILLELLDANGVDDVHIIIANSLHRRMTDAEMKRMVGTKIYDAFYPDRYYNHDAEDPDGIVHLGKTDHGEPVNINRRCVESDLVIYVNINLVPMDGGHKSVAVGLCDYESLRAAPRARDHPRVGQLHGSEAVDAEHEGRAAGRAGRPAHERVPHRDRAQQPHLRRRDRVPVQERGRVHRGRPAEVRGDALDAVEDAARREAEAVPFDPGAVPDDRRATRARPSRCTSASCQALLTSTWCTSAVRPTSLICPVPFISPYNVNSILNPLLVQVMGLGYFHNFYRGKPLLKKGGVMILTHPCYDEFDHKHHPSYIEFFNRLLPETRDAMKLRHKYEEEFAKNPSYIEMYRRGNAYHGAHPFFMWYWGENGRQHVGKVIVAGAENAHVPAILGWDRADSLTEAIAMAKSAVGPSPDITMMHHPPIVMADME